MKYMKKTAAIISLYGNSNYGNKLQNYAVQEILRREGIDSVNIINVPCLNNKNRDISAVLKFYLKGIVQSIIKGDRIKDCVDPNDPKQRKENFLRLTNRLLIQSIFSPSIDCRNLKITTIILWDRTKYGILSMVD